MTSGIIDNQFSLTINGMGLRCYMRLMCYHEKKQFVAYNMSFEYPECISYPFIMFINETTGIFDRPESGVFLWDRRVPFNVHYNDFFRMFVTYEDPRYTNTQL